MGIGYWTFFEPLQHNNIYLLLLSLFIFPMSHSFRHRSFLSTCQTLIKDQQPRALLTTYPKRINLAGLLYTAVSSLVVSTNSTFFSI